MATFQDRLDKAAEAGALSTVDLATWFDFSDATMRSFRNGSMPVPARRAQIEQRLTWLESAIKNDPRLPVPLSVRAGDRKAYITGVRDSGRRKR